MEPINILKTEYWSKSDAFLLPLTGLTKDERYEMRSYLFWDHASIHDYKMVLEVYTDEDTPLYYKKRLFPILDRGGYLLENYDFGDRNVFILDMSEWGMDIQMFLNGKYSKFSREAKSLIERFHTFNRNNIPIYLYAVLYPNTPMVLLDKMTPIEYISQHYGINLDQLTKLGEIGSIYDKMNETLILDVRELCDKEKL